MQPQGKDHAMTKQRSTQLPIAPRHEGLRIAGRRVDRDETIPVHDPYSGESVGSVAAATRADVEEAFAIAAAFQSSLTRYDRQKILLRTAQLIAERKDDIAPIVTAELGVSLADAKYECGRACDVFTLSGQLCPS